MGQRSDLIVCSFVMNKFFFLLMLLFCINVLGEANFLGGVAAVKGVKGFDPEAAKKRFFEIYLDKVNEFCQSSFVILLVYCNKREFL